MKPSSYLLIAALTAGAFPAAAQVLPGAPESNGLIPKTATGYINGTNGINNHQIESLSVDIANNGNVIVGWEDDENSPITVNPMDHFLGVWTLLDPNGNMITPQTVQTNRDVNGDVNTLQSTTNQYLSFFRSDNTPTPGWPGGWGPKVKANRFGNGMGMGTMSWAIGLEVPELFDINEDAGGVAAGGGVANLAASDDFPCVQLLNNDGTPLRLGPINGITNLGIVTLADADVQPAGAIRIGGWDYLGSGNILIVGHSRQAADRALTGQAGGNVPVYRIVTPGGIQVKGYSAVSATAVGGNVSRNGAAVTANGFAVRWEQDGVGTTVRLFDNGGNPTTTNLPLASLTGHPQANGGGDGGSHGISGNGKDAYVLTGNYSAGTYGPNGVWVTVLNANGTVRWSRDVASDLTLTTNPSGSSAAIDESGQVAVVFSASPDPFYGVGVMGRRFDAAGNPVGGTFYISEMEIPDPNLGTSGNPKVAWRNGKIAVTWFSRNYVDPSLAGIADVIAYRFFIASQLPGAPESNGLTPKTTTGYINGTNAYSINNASSEALSVDIANNGNVIVGWEDDGSGLADIESVWTLLDPLGQLITPPTVVSNRSILGGLGTYEVATNIFLSYYRSDNTSIPGYTGWGPKVRANRFGNGIGMAAMPWEIGLEIPELYDINEDAGGPPGPADDFPCIQLLNNDGTPLRLGPINGITNLGIVTLADADVQPAGAIRIGGWDYLGSGNIVIVGESRQADDRALTGQTTGRLPVYRVVTPAGVQVKAYAAVTAVMEEGNSSIARNGVAVTANGFAVRWQAPSGIKVRLFDNNGNPTSGNLDLATITGHPEANSGGDGGGAGINGNGKDSYVLVGDYAGTSVWVTVLNADGTVRWSREAADDKVLSSFGGTSAAIDESGQVVVVFSAKPEPSVQQGVMGRRFDAAGNPVGGTFYVSENEIPSLLAPLPYASNNPKVAWRNGDVAITWLSRNYPDLSLNGTWVVADRLFLSGPPSLTIAKVGGSVKLSWPPAVTGYTLESSSSLDVGAGWNPVGGVVNNSVTVSASGTQFYRLKK